MTPSVLSVVLGALAWLGLAWLGLVWLGPDWFWLACLAYLPGLWPAWRVACGLWPAWPVVLYPSALIAVGP